MAHSGSGKGGGRRKAAAALTVSAAAPITRSVAPPYFVNPATLEAGFGSWWGLGAGEAAAVGLGAVWRAVTLLADAISGRFARWSEWDGDRPVPLSRLGIRPCASLTRRRWTWRSVAALALYNRAPFWMIGGVDDEGVPGSLLPLPPDAVQPAGSYDELLIVPPARYTVGREEVSAEELAFAYRAELPTVPPHLAGLLILARRTFAQAIAADVAAANYWSQGGSPTTVLTSEQELTKGQADELAERWLDKRAKGRHYPAVLGRGAKAAEFGADPTKESASEARRDLVADVGRHFGIPPHLMNAPVGDTQTYATTEGEGRALVRYTLAGFADPLADVISDLLPGDNETGRRIEITLDELERPEMLQRFTAYEIGLRAGFLTLPEIRTDERRPPLPEPAESTGNGGEMPRPDEMPVDGDAEAAAAAAGRPGPSESAGR